MTKASGNPQAPDRASVLLLFVDGVGLAPAGSANPFSTTPTPCFERLLGGALTIDRIGDHAHASLLPLDACLGVSGLPQSATGQTALLSGQNAAALLGRHVVAFPGPRLRALLAERGLLVELARRGLGWTFANAFSDRYFEEVAARRRRYSVSTWSVLMAGGSLRTLDDLRHDRAAAWDIERDHFSEVPRRDAWRVGEDLVRLALSQRLTLYETFLSDLSGHGRVTTPPAEVVRRLDALVAGVVAAAPPTLDVVLISDHGNLEDMSHRQHTRNPVPLLALGPNRQHFRGSRSLHEVTPRLVSLLSR